MTRESSDAVNRAAAATTNGTVPAVVNETVPAKTDGASPVSGCEMPPADTAPAGEVDDSKRLAEKDAELASTIDRLKRLQAEFENYRKRSAREIAALRERTADDEICSFLPLFDGLERAFSVYGETRDAEAFVAGVEKIFGQFHQILEHKGLTRICTVGERFDPELHEALVSVPSDQERNTVLEELSPGYARAGRTLQPSKVAVSQGPGTEEKEES